MQGEVTTERSLPELLTLGDLAELLRLNRRTIQRMASGGKLPKPIRLSARCTRWRREEIVEWLESGCPARGK